MSEQLISALFDGECTPAEIDQALAMLDGSMPLKAKWSRQCLVRDALAGVRFDAKAVKPDLCASVMAALNEPEVADASIASQPASPVMLPWKADKSQEIFSALLDGECTDAELDQALALMDRSVEVKDKWSRQCLVRDALAGDRIATNSIMNIDLSASVMAAIHAESEIAEAAPVAASSKVVALPARNRGSRRWQPLIGLAAAASITGAVVIGGGQFLSGSGTPAAATVALAPAAAPANVPTERVALGTAEPQETRWNQLDAASANQLNDYLMEHSNYRAEQGMGGSLSYARMAVRTADYRPAGEQR